MPSHSIWVRYLFAGVSGGLLNWVWTQVTLCQILQLEVNHIRDTQRATREGRSGLDALKGGLPHVNTGRVTGATTAAKKTRQKKNAKGGGSMGAGMAAPQPVASGASTQCTMLPQPV